jgi:hypothetical protein
VEARPGPRTLACSVTEKGELWSTT